MNPTKQMAGLLEPDPARRTGRATKDLQVGGNLSQKKQEAAGANCRLASCKHEVG
jgi:hypothetical protein